MTSAAQSIVDFATPLFGGRFPVRLHCWDGSAAGPPEGVGVRLRSPNALRYALWAPGELGLARAYVTGELDVDGDLADGLSRAFAAAKAARQSPAATKWNPTTLARGVRLLASLGGIGRPLPAPESEARPRGRLHSKKRDAQVISHHYDLSNDFYALLLDDNMAYSCGYWTDDPSCTLADAQRNKLDLICRKLDLRPGARLFDLGCGWGSLTIHAAKYFGASVTAITVAREQVDFIQKRIRAESVGHLVDLRHSDYRDVMSSEGAERFDAVAAIEMGEHVGAEGYPAFLADLHRMLHEEGRLLIQAMSRSRRHPGGGPFIERYIAPDMHMRPVQSTVGLIQEAGFEVRDVHALREHYGRTIRAWLDEMESRWDDVVAMLGEEHARVWRLYLAGGALSFEQNRMGVDQILAVRPSRAGTSGMPPSRIGWEQPSESVPRPR